MVGLLFVDFEDMAKAARDQWAASVQPVLSVRVINFFTSDLEELAIISKHRIVSLPTFLVVDEKNKVKLRQFDAPTPDLLTEALQSIRS